MIKELKLLAEALWDSVKSDLGFFAPIQLFVKKLSEVDFSDSEGISDAIMYAIKIEEFFNDYRSSGADIYFPPAETSRNDNTVRRIYELTQSLKRLPKTELDKEIKSITPSKKKKTSGGGRIFIGHGRDKIWARVDLFLKDDFSLQTVSYESESRASESIVNILEDLLDQSSFAILVMTAEDGTINGKIRARQNVIHEAGLFQGRLGFDKVVILKQNGTEDFSNLAGLQYLSFTEDNIEQTFYELQRKLMKSGLI